MKNLKKIISLVLCLALAMAFGFSAMADDVVADPAEEVVAIAETEAPAEDAAEVEAAPVEDAEATEETEAPAEDAVAAEEVEAPAEDATATEEVEAAPEVTAPAEEVVAEPEAEAPAAEAPVVAVPENITVTVNGVAVVFDDIEPMIKDGRTLVPFRKVGEAMGAAVAWRSTDRTAHYFRKGTSVMMTQEQSEMVVREYEIGDNFVYTTEAAISSIDPNQPDVKAIVIDGRTMIPIRAAAEALGAEVKWDDVTRTVIINIPAYTATLADKDAAKLVETWNYEPATVLKNVAVNVKIIGNFEGASDSIGDGIVVKIGEASQTAANGGVCAFAEVKAGEYTIELENVPEGYAVNDEALKVTVKSGEMNVTLKLNKVAEAE